ncbi:unnamed protein product, partial [Meganyctiphanes norvegica]
MSAVSQKQNEVIVVLEFMKFWWFILFRNGVIGVLKFWRFILFRNGTYIISDELSSPMANGATLQDLRSCRRFEQYLLSIPSTHFRGSTEGLQDNSPIPGTWDDTAHVDDQYFSTEQVLSTIKTLTDLLKETFPNTLVYPVLGNHDYYPKSQLPPGMSDVQNGAADLWSDWLTVDNDDSALISFNSSGSYWMDVPGGSAVSIVGLNTLLWYKSNHNVNSDDEDPGQQFSWLQETLQHLAKRKRKVFLMGHIPPGTFERYQQTPQGFHWYQPKYNDRFIQIIVENSDVIKGQFFAHHHTDSFRLFFSESDGNGRFRHTSESRVPVSFQLLVPGVTPWKSSLSPETGANNPAIRLITYDDQTGQVLDILTYYLELDAANTAGEAKWELLYSFKNTYGLETITPQALYDVAKSIKPKISSIKSHYPKNSICCFQNYQDLLQFENCEGPYWPLTNQLNFRHFLDGQERSDTPSSTLNRWLHMIFITLRI